ncbi:MAG: hypothetical protein ACK5QT_01730 [Oligoflexia bacterium]
MKRVPSRKGATHGARPESGPETEKERRRTPRSRSDRAKTHAKAETTQATHASGKSPAIECCAHCAKPLTPGDRALFVEEEVGRNFCSEDCITQYFSPEVERLEAEYQALVRSGDLGPVEREQLAQLRWSTLQDPDEVWREKTLSGDHRYTLIARFEDKYWCICLSLFLKGEPSFLFLCIVSRNAALVEHYRKGERISWVKRKDAPRHASQTPSFSEAQQALDGTVIPGLDADLLESAGFSQDSNEVFAQDRLAQDGWSTEEALRASVGGDRREDDIPQSEFGVYQTCLEETLQEPSELWSLEAVTDQEEVRLYHFIRHYPESQNPENQGQGFWYVIVAREVAGDETQEDHLEVLDAFPTRDSERVAKFRQGNQELGESEVSDPGIARVLH